MVMRRHLRHFRARCRHSLIQLLYQLEHRGGMLDAVLDRLRPGRRSARSRTSPPCRAADAPPAPGGCWSPTASFTRAQPSTALSTPRVTSFANATGPRLSAMPASSASIEQRRRFGRGGGRLASGRQLGAGPLALRYGRQGGEQLRPDRPAWSGSGPCRRPDSARARSAITLAVSARSAPARAGGGSRRMRRVASIPSITGICTSISTTSNRSRAASATASAPSSASTHLVALPAQHLAQQLAVDRDVVGHQHARAAGSAPAAERGPLGRRRRRRRARAAPRTRTGCPGPGSLSTPIVAAHGLDQPLADRQPEPAAAIVPAWSSCPPGRTAGTARPAVRRDADPGVPRPRTAAGRTIARPAAARSRRA